MIQIDNKNIFLIGVCGSLGSGSLESLSKTKAKIIIGDRPGSGVIELGKKYSVPAVEIDVSCENSVKSAFGQVRSHFENIDGVVFNSAITSESLHKDGFIKHSFTEYPLDLWEKAIDINLTGAFLVAREAGKFFEMQNYGVLINTASVYGVVAPDFRIYEDENICSFPAYSASKSGLIGLTKWLSSLWAKKNIRVNCISPGGVFNNHSDSFRQKYSIVFRWAEWLIVMRSQG